MNINFYLAYSREFIKIAPVIAANGRGWRSRQQIVTNSRVNFVFKDKMLQYFNIFMLLTYISNKFSQNIWIL